MFEHELTDEYLKCNDISTSYLKLPPKIHAFIVQVEDIKYILINKNQSFYAQRLALIHELVHIDCMHLNCLASLKMQQSEFEAKSRAKEVINQF